MLPENFGAAAGKILGSKLSETFADLMQPEKFWGSS